MSLYSSFSAKRLPKQVRPPKLLTGADVLEAGIRAWTTDWEDTGGGGGRAAER